MPKFVLLLISIWVYLILLSNLGLETSGCRGDRPSKTKFLNQCKGFFSREDCNGRTVHGNHGGSVTFIHGAQVRPKPTQLLPMPPLGLFRFVTLIWTTNQQPKVFERSNGHPDGTFWGHNVRGCMFYKDGSSAGPYVTEKGAFAAGDAVGLFVVAIMKVCVNAIILTISLLAVLSFNAINAHNNVHDNDDKAHDNVHDNDDKAHDNAHNTDDNAHDNVHDNDDNVHDNDDKAHDNAHNNDDNAHDNVHDDKAHDNAHNNVHNNVHDHYDKAHDDKAHDNVHDNDDKTNPEDYENDDYTNYNNYSGHNYNSTIFFRLSIWTQQN
ncbi:hypothetical protein GPALN_006598 [Globodera pallida]|nr:hypothetical protein GPALN_006598 [Globodera pallida]